jgi:hypothetical protein
VLREQDLAEPQRHEEIFSQALEVDRAGRATLVSERDRFFDGGQCVPELDAALAGLDLRRGTPGSHVLSVA